MHTVNTILQVKGIKGNLCALYCVLCANFTATPEKLHHYRTITRMRELHALVTIRMDNKTE